MAFDVTDFQHLLSRPAVAALSRYDGVKYREASSHAFAVTRCRMRVIRCGQTVYTLRREVEGVFLPTPAGGRFSVEDFPDGLAGVGPTPPQAQRDWVTNFHVRFQTLIAMRPFEMTQDEQAYWSKLEEVVDVDAYRASQPLIALQQGKVTRARPYPQKIQWEDGTKEAVHLDRMPAEFATFKAGQPFEAMVHRDPVSHRLIKVEYVKRLRSRDIPEDEEAQRLLDSTPTSASLPDGTWD